MHSESPDRIEVTHSAAHRQYPERLLPLRRPEGHSPPIPRYSADLPAGKKIAVLFVGAQGRSIEVVRQANLGELCNNSEPQLAAPDYLDNAEYVDPEGYINHIAALYWSEASQFHEWRKSQAVAYWRARIHAEKALESGGNQSRFQLSDWRRLPSKSTGAAFRHAPPHSWFPRQELGIGAPRGIGFLRPLMIALSRVFLNWTSCIRPPVRLHVTSWCSRQ
jgi:hypothetical protein